MNLTKIEWCDRTWNPVTGCYHKCPYCYASRIANRFKHKDAECWESLANKQQSDYPLVVAEKNCCAFPEGFIPTFYWGRIDEPQYIKKPQNVFVCSMADLFGEWVPDEWIQAVFEACEKAPQHRYLFLTKNPKRYIELGNADLLPMYKNFWYGTTVTESKQFRYATSEKDNVFWSVEPLLGDFATCKESVVGANWVIVGAETGNRKGKIIPERKWIENIVNSCREQNIPVFLKNSLANIWGEPLIQEYPWR
jgi:protein gp37